jgi:hypothetical protein
MLKLLMLPEWNVTSLTCFDVSTLPFSLQRKGGDISNLFNHMCRVRMVYASTIETVETGIHIVNDGAVFLMGSVMEIVLNVPGLALKNG